MSQYNRLSLRQAELPKFIMKGFDYIRIIFFQFIGTALFAYGICCSQNQVPPYPTPSNYIYIANPGHSVFVSLSLFIAICWCGQLTGGHCNPAVTTVFMMKKNSEITLVVGLIYMISQIAGAFFGVGLAYILVDQLSAPLMLANLSVDELFQQFAGQIFGTFFFTFFILVITTKETTFMSSPVAIYATIVAMLYIARTFSFRTEGLNPALGISMQSFYSIYHKNAGLMAEVWVVFLGPYFGAILASLVFENFYYPLLVMWKSQQA